MKSQLLPAQSYTLRLQESNVVTPSALAQHCFPQFEPTLANIISPLVCRERGPVLRGNEPGQAELC